MKAEKNIKNLKISLFASLGGMFSSLLICFIIFEEALGFFLPAILFAVYFSLSFILEKTIRLPKYKAVKYIAMFASIVIGLIFI